MWTKKQIEQKNKQYKEAIEYYNQGKTMREVAFFVKKSVGWVNWVIHAKQNETVDNSNNIVKP